ncbi:hypothetical protein NPIL_100011 [Nephila pilipes]|uniref:Uncharacterized protein n=1 Tax=Nephila pilipes TaxID=299642 RepID=A0A8X6NRB6_NEPPI|nr:hypothetical protein NPIL_100011 [Nephila pilipes]
MVTAHWRAISILFLKKFSENRVHWSGHFTKTRTRDSSSPGYVFTQSELLPLIKHKLSSISNVTLNLARIAYLKGSPWLGSTKNSTPPKGDSIYISSKRNEKTGGKNERRNFSFMICAIGKKCVRGKEIR